MSCWIYAPDCQEKCGSGFFGVSCASHCPATCTNRTCHPDNGFCIQCRVGFTGPKCSLRCRHGFFGQNCSSTCPPNCLQNLCDPFTGFCKMCVKGYEGVICEKLYSYQNNNSETRRGLRTVAEQVWSTKTGGHVMIYIIIIVIACSLPVCTVVLCIKLAKRSVKHHRLKPVIELESDNSPTYTSSDTHRPGRDSKKYKKMDTIFEVLGSYETLEDDTNLPVCVPKSSRRTISFVPKSHENLDKKTYRPRSDLFNNTHLKMDQKAFGVEVIRGRSGYSQIYNTDSNVSLGRGGYAKIYNTDSNVSLGRGGYAQSQDTISGDGLERIGPAQIYNVSGADLERIGPAKIYNVSGAGVERSGHAQSRDNVSGAGLERIGHAQINNVACVSLELIGPAQSRGTVSNASLEQIGHAQINNVSGASLERIGHAQSRDTILGANLVQIGDAQSRDTILGASLVQIGPAQSRDTISGASLVQIGSAQSRDTISGASLVQIGPAQSRDTISGATEFGKNVIDSHQVPINCIPNYSHDRGFSILSTEQILNYDSRSQLVAMKDNGNDISCQTYLCGDDQFWKLCSKNDEPDLYAEAYPFIMEDDGDMKTETRNNLTGRCLYPAETIQTLEAGELQSVLDYQHLVSTGDSLYSDNADIETFPRRDRDDSGTTTQATTAPPIIDQKTVHFEDTSQSLSGESHVQNEYFNTIGGNLNEFMTLKRMLDVSIGTWSQHESNDLDNNFNDHGDTGMQLDHMSAQSTCQVMDQLDHMSAQSTCQMMDQLDHMSAQSTCQMMETVGIDRIRYSNLRSVTSIEAAGSQVAKTHDSDNKVDISDADTSQTFLADHQDEPDVLTANSRGTMKHCISKCTDDWTHAQKFACTRLSVGRSDSCNTMKTILLHEPIFENRNAKEIESVEVSHWKNEYLDNMIDTFANEDCTFIAQADNIQSCSPITNGTANNTNSFHARTPEQQSTLPFSSLSSSLDGIPCLPRKRCRGRQQLKFPVKHDKFASQNTIPMLSIINSAPLQLSICMNKDSSYKPACTMKQRKYHSLTSAYIARHRRSTERVPALLSASNYNGGEIVPVQSMITSINEQTSRDIESPNRNTPDKKLAVETCKKQFTHLRKHAQKVPEFCGLIPPNHVVSLYDKEPCRCTIERKTSPRKCTQNKSLSPDKGESRHKNSDRSTQRISFALDEHFSDKNPIRDKITHEDEDNGCIRDKNAIKMTIKKSPSRGAKTIRTNITEDHTLSKPSRRGRRADDQDDVQHKENIVDESLMFNYWPTEKCLQGQGDNQFKEHNLSFSEQFPENRNPNLRKSPSRKGPHIYMSPKPSKKYIGQSPLGSGAVHMKLKTNHITPSSAISTSTNVSISAFDEDKVHRNTSGHETKTSDKNMNPRSGSPKVCARNMNELNKFLANRCKAFIDERYVLKFRLNDKSQDEKEVLQSKESVVCCLDAAKKDNQTEIIDEKHVSHTVVKHVSDTVEKHVSDTGVKQKNQRQVEIPAPETSPQYLQSTDRSEITDKCTHVFQHVGNNLQTSSVPPRQGGDLLTLTSTSRSGAYPLPSLLEEVALCEQSAGVETESTEPYFVPHRKILKENFVPEKQRAFNIQHGHAQHKQDLLCQSSGVKQSESIKEFYFGPDSKEVKSPTATQCHIVQTTADLSSKYNQETYDRHSVGDVSSVTQNTSNKVKLIHGNEKDCSQYYSVPEDSSDFFYDALEDVVSPSTASVNTRHHGHCESSRSASKKRVHRTKRTHKSTKTIYDADCSTNKRIDGAASSEMSVTNKIPSSREDHNMTRPSSREDHNMTRSTKQQRHIAFRFAYHSKLDIPESTTTSSSHKETRSYDNQVGITKHKRTKEARDIIKRQVNVRHTNTAVHSLERSHSREVVRHNAQHSRHSDTVDTSEPISFVVNTEEKDSTIYNSLLSDKDNTNVEEIHCSPGEDFFSIRDL